MYSFNDIPLIPILQNKIVFVTGGCGYVGNRLVEMLLYNNVKIIHILDLKPFDESKVRSEFREDYKSKVRLFNCDIRNYNELVKCVHGIEIDVVFHIASYGMSGREMMRKDLTREVNVNGTRNIIDLCLEHNIPHLVYTSTYNVVFGGQELPNQTEDLPYFPFEWHTDEYSRTKAIAEEMVLKHNRSKWKNGMGELTTCALRPAAIYGEGEERHFPRIVNHLKNGLFVFTIGKKSAMVDFVYVDNLVYAHLLAASKLIEKQESLQRLREGKKGSLPSKNVDGEAFFISDQSPINNFEFMRPLVEGLGYRYPIINIPVFIMFYIAFLIEIIHRWVSPWYNFQPLLTRAEVYKVGISHYFQPKKAQERLGYTPPVNSKEGVKRLVLYWQEQDAIIREEHQKHQQNTKTWWLFLFIIIAIAIVFLSMIVLNR